MDYKNDYKNENENYKDWPGVLMLVICCVAVSVALWFAIFGADVFANEEEVDVPATNVVTITSDAPSDIVSDVAAEVTDSELGASVTTDISEITSEPENVPKFETFTYYDVPLDEDLQDHIFELCAAYNVDPAIIFAMIWKESTYNVNNIGDGGDSLGLMQVQPKHHQDRMDLLGCPDMMDPYQNVRVGIDLYASHLKVGGTVEYALMAYNGGGSYAKRKTRAGEVSYYARKVIEKSQTLTTYSVEKVVEE